MIFEKLQKEKQLTPELIQLFQKKFGDLFFRALDLLKKKGRIIIKHVFKPSNTEIWQIEGKSAYYLIFPDVFCQCEFFRINSIYRNQKFTPCKHILAQKLAQSLNTFKLIEHTDLDWKDFFSQLISLNDM